MSVLFDPDLFDVPAIFDGDRAAEVTLGGDAEQAGQTIGLHWVHFFDKLDTEYVWSRLDLPDPATYFGGFKEGRVLRFGAIQRALSDSRGEYEGTSFSWVVADTDRKIRGLLADVRRRYLVGRPAVIRTIADVDRRVQKTPRTLVRGVVRNYKPLSPLHFEFSARDHFAARFTVGNDELQIPTRTIGVADFPNCPPRNQGLPVPVIYGAISDKNEQSFIAPERVDGGVTAEVIGPAGGSTWFYTVTAIDLSSGPDPEDSSDDVRHDKEFIVGSVTVPNAPSAEQWSPQGYGGTDRYVRLNWYTHLDDAEWFTEGVGFRVYGREAGKPQKLLWGSRRPEGSALEGYGYRFNDSLQPERESVLPVANNLLLTGNFTPGSTVTFDFGVGAVPTIYVGRRTIGGTDWEEFLVCGHAVKEIEGWYLGGVRQAESTENVDFLIPGRAGWTAAIGAARYRDFNGRRYTVIYAKGAKAKAAIDDSQPLTVNVKGIEDVGDGSGALITSLPLQYRHALQNWLLGDYQSGAWLASPAFEDDASVKQIDDASFDAAKTGSEARIAGGYVGAFLLGGRGEQISLREAIARFNVSCDCDSGFNRKSQFFISMVTPELGLLDGAVAFTQVQDIFASTFNVEDRVDDMFNVVSFAFGRIYREEPNGTEWSIESSVESAESIANVQERRVAARVDLHMVPATAVDQANDLARRRLLRTQEPPRIASFEVGLPGLNVELGDILLVTHADGIGANGWSANPVRVIRHEFNPDGYVVRLEVVDVNYLFQEGFILGDRDALPADWDLASAAQRRYAFLGDRTTKLFGNNTDRIKRLR